ncbi:uncharacterized protein LOC141892311 isoform X2 [Acropora palmata]|uniref:uncharacterized protein LOC141892311 isoform X2 n=1 Tax=Acropora palmata TaxID=6131 RepID=UPI003DA11BFA
MSGILAPLILGAGAIGLFFNVCMLRIRIFYQKLRPLVICQLVFQIMILGMNTTEAWKRLYSTQHDQTEAVFGSKMIKLSMAVLLPFNIVAITAFLQSLHSLGRSESSLDNYELGSCLRSPRLATSISRSVGTTKEVSV